ncbi:MAG: hypothetical protein GY754_05150 [bacterium]|nr:hypothetical protein [bacterium]
MENKENIFYKLLKLVIPVIEYWRKNKPIDGKIEELKALDELPESDPNKKKSYFMKDYKKLSMKNATKYYEETAKSKEKLEEKAKANLFVVAISITLIIGLQKLLTDINNNNFDNIFFALTLFLLSFYSLINLIIAGLLSLKVISALNVFYSLEPATTTLSKKKQVAEIALCTEMNVTMDLKRNNYIVWSYLSIKNSLLALFILFILTSLPAMFHARHELKQISKSQNLIVKELKKIELDNVQQNSSIKNVKKIIIRQKTERVKKLKLIKEIKKIELYTEQTKKNVGIIKDIINSDRIR